MGTRAFREMGLKFLPLALLKSNVQVDLVVGRRCSNTTPLRRNVMALLDRVARGLLDQTRMSIGDRQNGREDTKHTHLVVESRKAVEMVKGRRLRREGEERFFNGFEEPSERCKRGVDLVISSDAAGGRGDRRVDASYLAPLAPGRASRVDAYPLGGPGVVCWYRTPTGSSVMKWHGTSPMDSGPYSLLVSRRAGR